MAQDSGSKPTDSHPNSASGRWNWIGLATVAIMALALAYQINQTKLLEDQLERQFAEPNLRVEAFYSASERTGLTEARNSIIEEFFLTIEERKRQDPELPYVELLTSVLPISRELSPAPVRVEVSVENVGNAPAQSVAISIEWQGAVTAIEAQSLTDWSETDGGVGASEVTIRLERIAKGETALLAVEYAAYGEAKDTLVLSSDEPSAASDASWPESPTEDLPFPAFRIEGDETVVDYNAINVRVGSDRTSVQVVEVKPMYPGFLAAYYEALNRFATPQE